VGAVKRRCATRPVLALLLLACAASVPAVADGPERPVVVFLVRHAEKVDDGSDDPDLTAAGRRRAAALARLLDGRATHLFSSDYRRTRETLAPLAGDGGPEIRVLPAGDLDGWVAALRALPAGSVAVVAGHSNTVPAIACRLARAVEGLDCAKPDVTLAHEEYDRLFEIVLPPPGDDDAVAPSGLSLRFGD